MLLNVNSLHSHSDLGSVAVVGGNGCDLIYNLHAAYNLTECRILAVKVGSICVHDKELAGCRVGIVGSCHGDYSSGVLQGIVEAVCLEFANDVVLGAAHAVTLGISALDHEAGNYSVEDKSVVEALAYKLKEVCYGLGCSLGAELKLDDAAVFHFDYYHFLFLLYGYYFTKICLYLNKKLFWGTMKDKIYNLLIISLALLSGGAVAYILLKYLLPLLAPFIIAWLVVTATNGASESLSGKLKIPKKIVRLIASLTLVLVLSLAIGLLIWQSISAMWRFLSDIGEGGGIIGLVERLFSSDRPLFGNLVPKEFTDIIGSSLDSLISSATSALASGATKLIGGLPTVFLFLIVTIISIIYLALDYDGIRNFILGLLPKKLSSRMSDIRHGLISVMGKYIRSYGLILLITYCIIFIGLSLLRVEHSPIIALLIAFLDILPVIGVGTVLVPWSVISLALGNRFLGIGLLLLFIVNAVLRQLIEPKILGKSLNLHPLVSLGAIYLGYAIFGFMGLFILPLVAVAVSAVLKNNSATKID